MTSYILTHRIDDKYIYEDVMVNVDIRSCFWERNSLLVSVRHCNKIIMKYMLYGGIDKCGRII